MARQAPNERNFHVMHYLCAAGGGSVDGCHAALGKTLGVKGAKDHMITKTCAALYH